MQPDAPYAAMTRAYLRQKSPRLATPDTPHPFVDLRQPLERIADLVEQYLGHLQELA